MNTRQKSTDETDDEHISCKKKLLLYSKLIIIYILLILVVHCLLRNRKAWLKNDGEHCSAATKKHPVTSLHDSKGIIFSNLHDQYHILCDPFS